MTTTASDAPVAPPRSEGDALPYADVVVDARTDKPDGAFTYAVPEAMRVEPGHLVLVPFGARTAHGVVAGLRETPNVDYTRPIAALVDEQPLLAPERIELGRWIAERYRAPLFAALAPMLPPGLRSRQHAAVKAAPCAPPDAEERLSEGAQRLLSHLRAHPRPHRVATLAKSLGPWARNAVRALVEAGAAVECVTAPQRKPPQERKPWLAPETSAAELRTLADEQPPRSHRRAELLRELAGSPRGLSAADARKRHGSAAVAKAVADGLASLQAAPSCAAAPQRAPLLPTPDQQRALAVLKRAMDDPSAEPRVWLLHGATGSGKTEVYLQAIAHCLAMGKRAVALVPEVALTPQMAQRFEERFPGHVGLLHSSLTPARQWNEWWRIFRGERSVVIGPRSALFAPVDNLGLIVLDEEHEWTYKQSETPHYHARDVAERLAALTGAVVVLGSATPDVATAWRAERGVIGKASLPVRIERSGAATALAEVDIVDMRTELREGNRSIFSRLLQERLQETLAAGRQSVLFLNRRGAASAVACRSCGFVMRCARCTAPLTHHSTPAAGGRLRCHYCGRSRGEPRRCPQCKSPHIRYLGLGTQRVADEVTRIAPDARVLRWDSDTASGTDAHERLLHTFAGGEADVLVGTQMVAKGLDVPSVDLVGVVLADIGIHMPDFRAAERTFQLLTQVAGRAGRGAQAGHAVIQTYLPEHYAVQTAAAQDYAAFYAAEMERRRAQGNPPYSRLVRLLYDGHSNRDVALREAQSFAGRLRRTVQEWDMRGVDVVGPAPTHPPRIQNAWRWHLLIRGPEPRILLDKVSVPPSWRVDVDPVNIV